MKITILFSMLLLFFPKNYQSNKVIAKIQLKYVDFEVLTFYSIRCDDFEDYFGDEIETKEVTNKGAIKKISGYLDNMEKRENQKYPPDTRMEIYVICDDNSVAECRTGIQDSI